MKAFNTAGTCRPNEHYMVDITERLEIIRKMVAKGDYFCINRVKYSWDKDGILKAVYAILVGDEPFWKDAKRTIENEEDLKDLLQCVIEGQYVCYTPTIE